LIVQQNYFQISVFS